MLDKYNGNDSPYYYIILSEKPFDTPALSRYHMQDPLLEMDGLHKESKALFLLSGERGGQDPAGNDVGGGANAMLGSDSLSRGQSLPGPVSFNGSANGDDRQ